MNFSSPQFFFLFLNPPLPEIPISCPVSPHLSPYTSHSCSTFLPLVQLSLPHLSTCHRHLQLFWLHTDHLATWGHHFRYWKTESRARSGKDFKKSERRLYLSSAWWDGTSIEKDLLGERSAWWSCLAVRSKICRGGLCWSWFSQASPADCAILAGRSWKPFCLVLKWQLQSGRAQQIALLHPQQVLRTAPKLSAIC